MHLASCLVYMAVIWVIYKLVDAKTGGQIGPEKFQYTQSFGTVFQHHLNWLQKHELLMS